MAEACRALHISRAGYYQWRSGKAGARTVENRRLAGLVKQIHDESPDKGYRRIRDDWKAQGFFVPAVTGKENLYPEIEWENASAGNPVL